MKFIPGILLIASFLMAGCQPIVLQGKVINEKSEPVPGAVVAIKGTNRDTLTDKTGRVIMPGLTILDTLVVSAEGYQSQEVPMNERGLVTVVLEQD